jgi:hypothetical protein
MLACGSAETLAAATARTPWPIAPLLEKKGPVSPSFPADAVITTPLSTRRLERSAHVLSEKPFGWPILVEMTSAYEGLEDDVSTIRSTYSCVVGITQSLHDGFLIGFPRFLGNVLAGVFQNGRAGFLHQKTLCKSAALRPGQLQ